jgi:hypothetical protein
MQGDTRNGTPRVVLNEAENLYEYHYEPVWDTDDKANDRKQLIGWKLITNHFWMPLIDPPRLIDQYQLAYYDARFTTRMMHLKWKANTTTSVDVARRIIRNLDNALSPFPPPWPQQPQTPPRSTVPFTFDNDGAVKSL